MNARKRRADRDAPDSDILPAPAVPAREPEAPAPLPGEDEPPSGPQVRLNKFLAAQGVASRRKCDELILGGRVSVDGEVVRELGVRVDPTVQEVEVDGQVFRAQGARRRYYLLNKPRGVVCTNEERETRPRAVDLITDPRKGRIFTVGRLDEESEGLILITNDGDFAQRVMHPRYGVEKTYEVEVFGRIEDEAIDRVRGGVHLSEGRTAGARVLVKSRKHDSSRLSVSIREGMNREIRRSFARVGHKVLHLRRVRIGPISDRGLKPGRWRELEPAEVRELLSGGAPAPAGRPRRSGDRPPRKPRTHSGKPGIARRHAEVEERRTAREERGGPRVGRAPRGEHGQRGQRPERGQRGERGQRQERGERGQRPERGEHTGRAQRPERGENRPRAPRHPLQRREGPRPSGGPR